MLLNHHSLLHDNTEKKFLVFSTTKNDQMKKTLKFFCLGTLEIRMSVLDHLASRVI